MDKIAIVVPPMLSDNPLKNRGLRFLVNMLSCDFSCTCITRGREDGNAVSDTFEFSCNEKDVPSYTQRNYMTWRHSKELSNEYFASTMAIDGLHPWALAALDRLKAKRRFVWICDMPKDYLLDEDIPFFESIYGMMSWIFCANESIQENFSQFFPKLVEKSMVVSLPLDTVYYRRLAKAPKEVLWASDTADIFTVCRLESENDAQKIPQLAAEWKLQRTELRWHIACEGVWWDKLLREIVLNDVCETVEMMEIPKNIAPFMAQANAYLAIDEAGDEEAEQMAYAMGKTILHLPLTDDRLLSIKACAGKPVFSEWKDRERFMKILKEK